MPTYKVTGRVIRRNSFALIVPLALVLVFMLSACGTNSSTGAASHATPAPTVIKGYGTAHGCPSDVVVNPSQPQPDVIVGLANRLNTIIAHTGNLIQVQLPFGQAWHGPTTSQGVLTIQAPAGYALMSQHMCIWRFVAHSTGTVQLDYSARSICKPPLMCPLYILSVPFTVKII